MSEVTLNPPSLEQINKDLARTVSEEMEKNARLTKALEGLLAEPYGCTLCDFGKPHNEAKGHQPDCPFVIARAAINKATGDHS